MKSKYKAMVLSCMDPRFQHLVYNYLKKKKLTGKYSAFTIAGAAVGVTHNKFKQCQKTFYDNYAREIYLAILEEINTIVKENGKTLIIGYMDTTSKLNKEIFKSIIEKDIIVVDLTLDKKDKANWLPDKHTSKLGNEKRVFLIQRFLKKNLYLD